MKVTSQHNLKRYEHLQNFLEEEPRPFSGTLQYKYMIYINPIKYIKLQTQQIPSRWWKQKQKEPFLPSSIAFLVAFTSNWSTWTRENRGKKSENVNIVRCRAPLV